MPNKVVWLRGMSLLVDNTATSFFIAINSMSITVSVPFNLVIISKGFRGDFNRIYGVLGPYEPWPI